MTNFNSMPMLILRGMVVFPGMLLHFDVGRKKSIAAVHDAMESDQKIFLITVLHPEHRIKSSKLLSIFKI